MLELLFDFFYVWLFLILCLPGFFLVFACFVLVRYFFSTLLNHGVKVAFRKIIENPIMVGAFCLGGPLFLLIWWMLLERALDAFGR